MLKKTYQIKSDIVAGYMRGPDSSELKDLLREFGVEAATVMTSSCLLVLEGTRLDRCELVLDLFKGMDERLILMSGDKDAVRKAIMTGLSSGSGNSRRRLDRP